MYSHAENQLEFFLPFGGKLSLENRWVKLAQMIPWAKFEKNYCRKLKGSGPPAKSVRVALGALIIKERLRTTDDETVEQIRENPYLQYFLGFKEYSDDVPFHSTMFVHFRKRITREMLCEINEVVIKETIGKKQNSEDDDPDSGGGSSQETKGKLLIDATCTPADITFPTDLKLLNKAREKSEEIIDILHKPYIGVRQKPRTYRKRARKDFLSASKSKKLSKSRKRKAIRRQLGYLGRNLKTIDNLSVLEHGLSLLDRIRYKNLLVINEVYRQQKWMYEHCENKIDDRIVSISQPHVRPIKRGKAGSSTEFGAKISASVVDGYCFLDHLEWNNFNESGDLIDQIQAYKERFGCYPASVHADKIYRNRKNLQFCKERGIRLSGPPLGRPAKDKPKRAASQKITRQDEIERIPIEGKFGQAKRRFSLSRVMCKLARTSEAAIAIVFLVMNLEKWVKALFFNFFLNFVTRFAKEQRPAFVLLL